MLCAVAVSGHAAPHPPTVAHHHRHPSDTTPHAAHCSDYRATSTNPVVLHRCIPPVLLLFLFCIASPIFLLFFFFFNDPAPPEISPLPLHDPLPISPPWAGRNSRLHIIGVSVSDTTAETTTAMVKVSANSRNMRPTSPVMNSRGMNTAISDTVSERSEEHTSELQSQSNLVCRLLLEK